MGPRESHIGSAGFLRCVFAAIVVLLVAPWAVRAEEKQAEGQSPLLFSLSAATQPAEAGTTTAPAEEEEKPKKPTWPLMPSFGDEGMTDYLDWDIISEQEVNVDYRFRLYRPCGVGGQSTDMGMVRHDFGFKAFSFPLPQTVRVRALDFDTEAVLPDTGERFPRCLWDIRAKTFFPWPMPFGIMSVTFGSASDKPFASADEMTADITYLTGDPDIEKGFLFIVNYSNNRDYLNRCPLPGFEYRLQPKKSLKMVLGFPLSGVRWEPSEKYSLSAIYQFPRTVRARAAYRPIKPLKLFAGFDWDSQRYFRHDRRKVEDRLWYVEKRLSAGARWEITEDVYLDLSGGYAFDRFFFEGETYEDRDFNRLNIADGPFLDLQFGIRF